MSGGCTATSKKLASDDRYDVVITNFVLDMYAGAALDQLMRRLLSHLRPAGYWLFTDFRLPAKGDTDGGNG